MAYNPFIFKQFVKSFITSIEFFEATFKIAETVTNSQKYIKTTDNIKQKIEDKTGIHISRHKEDKYEKYLTYDDPRLEAAIKEFGITDESAARRFEEDMRALKKERRRGTVPAILFNIMIWSFLFKIIYNLFQY